MRKAGQAVTAIIARPVRAGAPVHSVTALIWYLLKQLLSHPEQVHLSPSVNELPGLRLDPFEGIQAGPPQPPFAGISGEIGQPVIVKSGSPGPAFPFGQAPKQRSLTEVHFLS